MSETTGRQPGDAVIILEREFEVPQKRVFQAWADREEFASWFGSDLDRTEIDFRPGGDWRAAMTYEGQDIKFAGQYSEIREPERLVLTMGDGTDSRPAVVTVDLTELGGSRTKLRFEQVGPLPEELVEETENGWQAFFDAMAENFAKS